MNLSLNNDFANETFYCLVMQFAIRREREKLMNVLFFLITDVSQIKIWLWFCDFSVLEKKQMEKCSKKSFLSFFVHKIFKIWEHFLKQ